MKDSIINLKKFLTINLTFLLLITTFFTVNTTAYSYSNNPLWIDIGGPYFALVNEPIQFYLDIQGGMLPYYHDWDFGDGNTSTLRYPVHSYENIGTYSVRCTVTDGEGTSLTKYANAIIYDELTVDSGGPYTGFEGETIQLSANANGGISPYSFSWDLDNDRIFDDAFGDTTSFQNNLSGVYTIAVKVKDELNNENIEITEVTVNIFNTQPNKPDTPEGEVNGEIGIEYIYTSVGTDPEGDQIFYFWDWGDDNDSGWIGPYNSGQLCELSYIWIQKGDYEIKVRLKDSNGLLSDWSDPLQISMPKNQRISHLIYDLIDLIIQRYPIFEKFFLFHSFFNRFN
jgi:PKD repeat protein